MHLGEFIPSSKCQEANEKDAYVSRTEAHLNEERTMDKAEDDNRPPTGPDDGDLLEMLHELRVLLPSAQLLSAFLIAVPFTPNFSQVVRAEKNVFLATFILSVTALILFSAPAVQHRLLRPLTNRVAFKDLATRQMVAGSIALSAALVLASQLVLSSVLGEFMATAVAGLVAAMVITLWWVFPKVWRVRGKL